MLALLALEVDSILTPGMQVCDEIELLAGPRVKRMGNLETSAQARLHWPQLTTHAKATCESFMKTLKHEEVYRQEYRDLAEARASIGRFLEKVYNQKRLHSALSYRSPVEFENSLSTPSQPEQVAV
jgi:transposase InsO family protein